MTLDLQNPVQDFFHGKAAELPVGYKKLHQTWLARNPNQYVMSADEKIKSFQLYVGHVVLDREMALIERMQMGAEQKEEYRRMAKRGQLILASMDEGKHFDVLLKPEALSKTKTEDLTLLSTSLISQSTDLQEVMDIQVTEHAIAVLQNSGFEFNAIENVTLNKDGLVRVELENHPQFAEVQVDTRQSIQKPLDYVHIEHSGDRKHIQESLLPEEHGMPSPEAELQLPSKEAIVMMGDQEVESSALAFGAAKVLQASLAANQASQEVQNAKNIQRIQALQSGQNFQGNLPIQIQNIQKAKADVARRKEQQEKAQKRQALRQNAVDEQERKLALKKSKQEQVPSPAQASSSSSGGGKRLMMGALGAVAGFTAASGGTALFLTLF